MGYCLIALWLHYRRKKKRCQVFFLIFFSLGVGVWGVSVGGCVGVGRRVWVRGAAGWGWGGLDGGGMGMGGLDGG